VPARRAGAGGAVPLRIRRAIDRLRDEGRLIAEGRGRGTRWRRTGGRERHGGIVRATHPRLAARRTRSPPSPETKQHPLAGGPNRD
jgi:hypothetical protein